MKRHTQKTKCPAATVWMIIVLPSILIAGCSLFEENYQPGEQMPGGEWYAECDFGAGSNIVKGVINNSSVYSSDEKFTNQISFTLVRKYTDGTEDEDLLKDTPTDFPWHRIVCNEEDKSFRITGLPSWTPSGASYVVGEIFEFGGLNETGTRGTEGFRITHSFTTGDSSPLDIGTFTLKPINRALSLKVNLKYLYKGEGSSYSEATYQQLSNLGLDIKGTGAEESMIIFGGENNAAAVNRYALGVYGITDSDIRNQRLEVVDKFSGGRYDYSAIITVNGTPTEYSGGSVTIDSNNPSPEVNISFRVD